MFQDLSIRAKLKADNFVQSNNRKQHVRKSMIDFIEDVLPDIEKLGFPNIRFDRSNYGKESFHLRIQTRKGYDYVDYTYNIEFSSIYNNIFYGYGANSVKGKKIEFDYNWNDSKLIITIKHALRALISEALVDLEICKRNGWT